jgi:hypothetical protein
MCREMTALCHEITAWFRETTVPADVVDDEEDDDWKSWGRTKRDNPPDKEPPFEIGNGPIDMSKVMNQQKAGPQLTFARLRPDPSRTKVRTPVLCNECAVLCNECAVVCYDCAVIFKVCAVLSNGPAVLSNGCALTLGQILGRV